MYENGLYQTHRPYCESFYRLGDVGGDDVAVGSVSASALEAFLDSAADPEGGGAGRSDYNRCKDTT